MTSIGKIIASIEETTKCFNEHFSYPNTPGLYAFSLAKSSSLKEFGEPNQVIYVGKAEDSLKQRDLNTHFNDKRTGYSTLRRSIGAILKKDFSAIAFSRNGTLVKPNIDNYIFCSKAEAQLSKWMRDNLIIGYWEFVPNNEKSALTKIEEDLIKALKPTLDLDRRTRRYNLKAPALMNLRQICKDEATQNVINRTVYY